MLKKTLLAAVVIWFAATGPVSKAAYMQPFTAYSMNYYLTSPYLYIYPSVRSSLLNKETTKPNPVTIASARDNESLVYVVGKGDTLSQISRQFDVSIDSLVIANALDDPNMLQIGQRLRVPDAKADIAEHTNISKVLSTTLTAYTAGVESTGKTPDHPAYGITYSGKRAAEGRTIAVDPDIIPLGTKVWIDGIGLRTAEDIGSAIQGNRIDVFMNDVGEALEFGVKKNVKVYVLEEEIGA